MVFKSDECFTLKDIKPGGVADRDGRLKEKDQILIINDKALDPTISHEEAIGIMKKVKGNDNSLSTGTM